VALLVELLGLLPLDVQQQGRVELVVQQAQRHRALTARSFSGRPGRWLVLVQTVCWLLLQL
jgi:hypothetical protein